MILYYGIVFRNSLADKLWTQVASEDSTCQLVMPSSCWSPALIIFVPFKWRIMSLGLSNLIRLSGSVLYRRVGLTNLTNGSWMLTSIWAIEQLPMSTLQPRQVTAG